MGDQPLNNIPYQEGHLSVWIYMQVQAAFDRS